LNIKFNSINFNIENLFYLINLNFVLKL